MYSWIKWWVKWKKYFFFFATTEKKFNDLPQIGWALSHLSVCVFVFVFVWVCVCVCVCVCIVKVKSITDKGDIILTRFQSTVKAG